MKRKGKMLVASIICFAIVGIVGCVSIGNSAEPVTKKEQAFYTADHRYVCYADTVYDSSGTVKGIEVRKNLSKEDYISVVRMMIDINAKYENALATQRQTMGMINQFILQQDQKAMECLK